MARRLLVLLLAAVVVGTTGCLKVDVAIDVHDDGSGAIRTVQAVDVDALAQSGGGTVGPGDLLPDRGDLPDRVSASRYRQDGYEGVELRAEFGDLDELDSRLQDIADAFIATFESQGVGRSEPGDRPPGDSLAGFRIARTVDGWIFVGDGPRRELSSPDARSVLGAAELRLQVRLPGRPLPGRHNADEVDGNTFIWNLGAGDQRDELFAQTGPGSPASSDGRWLWAGLMVGFAALATLCVVWLARRNHATRPPRPPRPPRAARAPRPAARPTVTVTVEEPVVDATGWPRHPPSHPPLLPPHQWIVGAAPMPQGSWPVAHPVGRAGAAPTHRAVGVPEGAASPATSSGVAASGGPAPGGPAPPAPTFADSLSGESTSNRSPSPVEAVRAPGPGAGAVPRPPAVTPDAERAAPAPAPWRPPPGWPNLGRGPAAPSAQEAPPVVAVPTGLTLPPRRPTDLQSPPPGSPGGEGVTSPGS